MTRLCVSALALFVLAGTCRATSYRKVSLAELVGRSDVIVVAQASEVNNSTIRLEVTRCLGGTVKRRVSIPAGRLVVENPGKLRVGDTRIFFLCYYQQELRLVYDFAFASTDRLDEVLQLLEMRTAPEKYVTDPRHASSPAFLEVLSHALGKRTRIGDLDRAAVIKHFERQLIAPQSDVILLALDGLKRAGSKQSGEAIVPLLRHDDDKVRLTAERFRDWAEGRGEEAEQSSERPEWPADPVVEETDAVLDRLFSAPAVVASLVVIPLALGVVALFAALGRKRWGWVLLPAIGAVTLGASDLTAVLHGESVTRLGIDLLSLAGGSGLLLGIAACALAWFRRRSPARGA